MKSHDGKIILTPQIVEEINKLRSHIAKGCLSHIAPGRGTNKDESLHKRINNFMRYSKVGMELAYALLISVFDRYNEDVKKPSERKSILEYVTQHLIGPKSESNVLPPKFGLTTSPRQSDISTAMLQETESNEEDDGVSDSHLIELLENVKVLSRIVREIKEKGVNRAVFNERYIPFMKSATSLFLHKKTNTETEGENNYKQHVDRLSAVVQGWGFQLERCDGDGNCFFYSAAVALRNTEKDESCSHALESMGITNDMSISAAAYRLRQLIVAEWSTNPDRYQPFCQHH